MLRDACTSAIACSANNRINVSFACQDESIRLLNSSLIIACILSIIASTKLARELRSSTSIFVRAIASRSFVFKTASIKE